MLELNHESVRKIKTIVVTKRNWTISFSSDVYPSGEGNWFELAIHDVYLKVDSRVGAYAMVTTLARIIGKGFEMVLGGDEDCICFCREDCLEEWEAARSAESCQV